MASVTLLSSPETTSTTTSVRMGVGQHPADAGSSAVPSVAKREDRPALVVDTTTQSPPRGPRRRSRDQLTGVRPSAGAPSVWIAPDWASYPIIENFYGPAPPRRPRASSFYEVMCSPTDRVPTTTLGATCCGYDDDSDPDSDGDSELKYFNTRHGHNAGYGARRAPSGRLAGSFAYSCSTDTSEEAMLALVDAVDADDLDPSKLWHATSSCLDMNTVDDNGVPDARRRCSVPRNSNMATAGSGFAAWDRLRRRRTASDRTGDEFVPVPYASGDVRQHHDAQRHALPGHPRRRRRSMENPQGGGSGSELSPMGSLSHSDAESPAAARTPSSSSDSHSNSSSRLRVKLRESLMEIDSRLAMEHELSRTAQRMIKKAGGSPSKQPNPVWNLLCGARTSMIAPSDGLSFLYERLAVFVHNRALNQLQRHRRHVAGILQIVTSHNPDLELTEKQLDSFETADAMLGNDVKYALLRKQVDLLGTRMIKRKEALVHAKINNGNNCFDRPRVKSAMLRKLLEAVSWYRLVQLNSREESASSSVAAPPSTSSLEGALSEISSTTASSIMSTSRALQELQVEKILNVLAGEDFYSDYNELMCRPDWWEIAQAHFENIIFSATESRVCQWMNQMSQDVLAASEEKLDEEFVGPRAARNSHHAGVDDAKQHLRHARRAEWLQDPSPDQLVDFIERVTHRIRREFDVANDVSKSLHAFIQRMMFARVAVLCFNQRAIRDCQRKDKLWRKKCAELSGVEMESLGVPSELAAKIRAQLPSRRISKSRKQRVYLVRAIEAFNGMTTVVPCDLLEELMHGVVILHHEAALVLGTTQFSVETFFPLLAYVLLHCHLPLVHAQLHLLESFAINNANANGEESYYVYCVHAAVEYVCNTASSALSSAPPSQTSETATPSVAPLSAVQSVGGEADALPNAKLSAELKSPPHCAAAVPERSSIV